MPDSRIAATSVLSPTPTSGIEALGIVDLNSPSPGASGTSSGITSQTSSTGSGSTFHDMSGRNGGGVGGRGRGQIGSGDIGQGHASAASIAAYHQQRQHQQALAHRSYASQSHPTTYTTTADTVLSADALGLPPDTEITRIGEGQIYRVRAVYDFDATDESALSFRAGDVIEVLTLLPSGWWDGMLGSNRGWFPSNYVEDVREGEEFQDDDDDQYDDYDVDMAPDGTLVHRNGTVVHDIYGGGDLARGWDTRDWMGSTASLDEDLLAEIMQDPSGQALTRSNSGRRRRTDSLASRASRSSRVSRSSRASYQSVGRVGPAAVTTGNRRSGDPHQGHVDPDETLQAPSARHHKFDWVPDIIDGQVVYYNQSTGEHRWDLPDGDGGSELGVSRPASQASNQRPRNSWQDTRRPTSYGQSHHPEDFRPPVNRASLPHPWVQRITDDGRSRYFENRLTGERRHDLPPQTPATATTTASGQGGTEARRPSVSTVASTALSVTRPPRRSSLRYSQVDWEDRIRTALVPLYKEPPQPTLHDHVKKVYNLTNDLYEAARDGSDVQAEKAEAEAAHVGMQQALAKDFAACAMLKERERAVIDATRDLFLAVGYVGPLLLRPGETDTEATQRPAWVTDMSVVGVLGLVMSTVRIATEGLREGATSRAPWDNVMRAALKMHATLESFPPISDLSEAELEAAPGRHLVAWFGADNVGDFMGGRFGFGQSETRCALDQSAVIEVQKVKTQVDAALRTLRDAGRDENALLEVIRLVNTYRNAVTLIDVAVVIDLDGDKDTTGESQHPEDARHYAEFVMKARKTLRELDEVCMALDDATADLFMGIDEPGSQLSTRELVGQHVRTVFVTLSSILSIAQQQAATVESGTVRGSIGGRSPAAKRLRVATHKRGTSVASIDSLHPAHNRVHSQHTRNASGESAGSRATRVTSSESEQEFLDGDDRRSAAEDRPSTSSNRLSRTSQPSASTSQTSLVKPDASSSSTSLGQRADSEAGSIRGVSNRASILKAVPSFLRTSRSESVSQGSKSSKKLSRIKDDRSSMILSPPPPAPMTAPPPAAMRPSVPWYLSSDYRPGEIVFDEEKGSVKAGTIRALIERLTPHTSADTAFFQAFLLTYRSFVSTDDLVELLLERYHIAPPADLTEEQMSEWKTRKQTPIRLRVANTLKTWLEHHYIEKLDRDALDVVENFATSTLVTDGKDLMSKQLLQLVDRRRRGDSTTKSRIVMDRPTPHPPILPKTLPGKPLTLLDIQPLELARQLTILEAGIYVKLTPPEFLNKKWQKLDTAYTTAPNIMRSIDTANKISAYCQDMILKQADAKGRATIIKYLVRTSVECRGLNNFSSMAAINAGLGMSGIQRLRKTWELLPEKTMKDYAYVEEMMSSTKNFARHKEVLKTINPPCVPFLGFYLSMLVFIEDGNRDYVPAPLLDASGNVIRTASMARTTSMTSGMTRTPSSMDGSRNSLLPSTPVNGTGPGALAASTSSAASTGTANSGVNGGPAAPPQERPMLINFFKRGLTADIVRDVQQYQAQPYNLALCQPVMDFLEDALANVSNDAEEFYTRSCMVEPKDPSRVQADNGAIRGLT